MPAWSEAAWSELAWSELAWSEAAWAELAISGVTRCPTGSATGIDTGPLAEIGSSRASSLPMDDPADLTAPRAPRRPTTMTAHGDQRIDEWAWLRNRQDPAVLDHLRAEQAYTEMATSAQRPLQDRLFAEIRSRIVETDLSVPVAKDQWWYYQRTVEGLDYPLHCRAARDDQEAPPPAVAQGSAGQSGLPGEQVILDENRLVEVGGHLSVGDLVVSPDHRLLAFSIDTTGDERFALRVINIEPAARSEAASARPGAALPPAARPGMASAPAEPGLAAGALVALITGTSYGVAWADNRTLFYTRPDEANRPFQLWRHIVGQDPGRDVLIYQEDDERFHLGVSRTKDGTHVLLELHSKVTSEIWVLTTTTPLAEFSVVIPRRPGVEYTVEHLRKQFVILTNDGAENFRVMAMASADAGSSHPRWSEVVGGRQEARIDGIDVFDRHLVVYERFEADARIRVLTIPEDGDPFAGPLGPGRLIPCPDTPSTSWGGANPDPHSHTLRYEYSSLITPRSVYDLDMDTLQTTLRKQQQVLGNFDPDAYVSQRLWADAPDGTRVPVSVVRRSDTPLDGTAACLLYGYGAYEHSIDPMFSSIRLSLLDRGMVFAIGHVRGGGELGRHWYEQGKLQDKPNSMTDFVACADMLVERGIGAPDRLVARGGSAGGLLVGGAMNLAPQRFRAVVAEVPFVDCLTTMLDDTLPLTVIERDEWGDPEADPAIYRIMRAYSPYDNVRPVRYPDVLATAGLEDPRVGYWEPAKWVQRLRAAHPDNRVLLKVELQAGHGGPTGRYDAWRDEAFILAFVLASVSIDQ